MSSVFSIFKIVLFFNRKVFTVFNSISLIIEFRLEFISFPQFNTANLDILKCTFYATQSSLLSLFHDFRPSLSSGSFFLCFFLSVAPCTFFFKHHSLNSWFWDLLYSITKQFLLSPPKTFKHILIDILLLFLLSQLHC